MQLTLFHLPRVCSRGEPVRCALCGAFDHEGGFGPPGIEDHADAWSDRREENWYCAHHGAKIWEDHMRRQRQLPARRRRIEVFRQVEAEGLTGAAKFAEAERRLAEMKS